MGGTKPTLEGSLLALQVLLTCIRDRHVASVYTEAVLVCGGAQVVVWCSRIPKKKVTGLSGHLDPLETFLLKPLHAVVGKAIPLRVPGGDVLVTLLLRETDLLVELLADEVATLENNETAVVGSIGKDVDQTLQAAEAVFRGVLVLVRPRRVGCQVFATSQAKIDGVKGDNEVVGLQPLFECSDDTRLRSDFPDKVFVSDGVVEAHTLVVDLGKVSGGPCGTIISVEAKAATERVNQMSGLEF